jgi:hypothetical protein
LKIDLGCPLTLTLSPARAREYFYLDMYARGKIKSRSSLSPGGARELFAFLYSLIGRVNQ